MAKRNKKHSVDIFSFKSADGRNKSISFNKDVVRANGFEEFKAICERAGFTGDVHGAYTKISEVKISEYEALCIEYESIYDKRPPGNIGIKTLRKKLGK